MREKRREIMSNTQTDLDQQEEKNGGKLCQSLKVDVMSFQHLLLWGQSLLFNQMNSHPLKA